MFRNLLRAKYGRGGQVLSDKYERTGNTQTYLGSTYNLDNAITDGATYSPRIYYRDGFTYIVLHKLNNATYGSTPIVVQYKHSDGTYQIGDTGFVQSQNDYHNVPNIMIDDDGYIYLFQDILHSLDGIRIVKSNNPHDVSAWTLLTEEIGSGIYKNLAYAYMLKFTNSYGVLTRSEIGNDIYDTVLFVAQNGLEDWANVYYPLIRTVPEDIYVNTRHYVLRPFGGYEVNGWNHMHLLKALTTQGGDVYWRDHWHIKTQDGITWYNTDESFSKNITTQGLITEDELNANFLIYTFTDDYAESVSTMQCVSPNGNMFVVLRGLDSGIERFHYFDQGRWNSKLYPQLSQAGFTYIKSEIMIAYSDFEFEVFATFNNDTTNEYHTLRFRTNDRFNTIEYVDDWSELDTTNNMIRPRFASNMHSIPNSDNTVMLLQSDIGKLLNPGDQNPTQSNNAYLLEINK